ncbi:MAG: efflux RND transporter periplasmic adaptor subunit [Ignavibacteriales bacterium]|nr:efflux RND transporter periplasmic adaptor subunit [Ignavibacteriales bacterium]
MKPLLALAQKFKNKKVAIPAAISFVLVIIIIISAAPDSGAVATSSVMKGPFAVSITTSGEIRATNSTTLTTPRVRTGQVQIIFLVPEGTIVKKDDIVVRFATTEVDKVIADKESELSILQSDLDKLHADRGYRMSDLEAGLKNAELAYEQAKLQQEKMKFEAEVARKEAEINLERNRIAFEQAKKKIVAQKIVDDSDENKQLLKIKQTQRDLDKAKTEKEQYTLHAPMPGLVVYENNWSTGRKINVGDSPWGGMALVSLPDLSQMQVLTSVNEVDVSKVKKEQSVKIKLDAFPDKQFAGKVISVGTIGQQKDRNSGIKTFEVVVDINGTDPILKPGMTTSSEIVMETLPDAIYIPLESVFEKDGKAVVYKMDGSSAKPQPVEVGVKNTNFIVITNGLKEGEKVTLRDPNLKSSPSGPATKPKEAGL